MDPKEPTQLMMIPICINLSTGYKCILRLRRIFDNFLGFINDNNKPTDKRLNCGKDNVCNFLNDWRT